jgi:uncharacterized protein YoaH (UPF0181 family)
MLMSKPIAVGDVVSINPHHAHGKKAIENIQRLMK